MNAKLMLVIMVMIMLMLYDDDVILMRMPNTNAVKYMLVKPASNDCLHI